MLVLRPGYVSSHGFWAYFESLPILYIMYHLYQIRSSKSRRMQNAQIVAPLGPLQANSVFPVQMVSAHAASGSD